MVKKRGRMGDQRAKFPRMNLVGNSRMEKIAGSLFCMGQYIKPHSFPSVVPVQGFRLYLEQIWGLVAVATNKGQTANYLELL